MFSAVNSPTFWNAFVKCFFSSFLDISKFSGWIFSFIKIQGVTKRDKILHFINTSVIIII